jgi:hypothetical protein
MSGVNVTDVFLFYQSSAMFILALDGTVCSVTCESLTFLTRFW